MRYPIAIERGDAKHAFGVIVPDLPGCFSAGDTFAEALDNAQEAIELHLEALLDANEEVPIPGSVDDYVADPGLAGMVWAFVEVPVESLDNTAERINLSVPRRVLRRIDAAAERLGRTRSSFMAEAALLCAREQDDQDASQP